MPFLKIFKLRLRKRRRHIVVRAKVSKKSTEHYALHKDKTRELVEARILYYVEIYKSKHGIELVPSGRVAIRNTRSRWGSCSSKKNLNFSYRLSLLPVHLADYIIVHELCHLREFNHGNGFWKLVALECPNFIQNKEELKKYSLRTL